jgi:glyoxylase-like metal-dependent hydrolase (beta-lactamase superfamily II)
MNTIVTFECGPLATNCYLVGDDSSKLAFVVDAPKDSYALVLSALAERGWTLTDILLTHTHWDHTADCHELQVSTAARVVVHIDDVYRLTDPMTHTIWPPSFSIPAVHEFEAINGSSGSLSILHNTATIDWVHTPGHTEGSICLLDRPRQVAYVGDTLFAGSIGRADLPGGDMETLCTSIKQELFCLPDEVIVYPGHGPVTTIGDEKQFNPFVGLHAS